MAPPSGSVVPFVLVIACEGNLLYIQVSVDVRLPGKGEYGLEIFANDPEKEGDMFTHVCQYLCFYSDGRTEDLYGKVPSKETRKVERPGEIREITAADLVNDAGVETPETGDSLRFLYLCIVIL